MNAIFVIVGFGSLLLVVQVIGVMSHLNARGTTLADTSPLKKGEGNMNRFVTSLLALVILGLTVTAWWYWPAIHQYRYAQIGWTDSQGYGQFGDAFGGFTALFTGIAFAGVVTAIYLQMVEIRRQQEEFNDTRLREEQRSKDERQFKLLEEFNSREMNGQRTAADQVLWDRPNQDLESLYAEANNKADPVWVVLDFYQKLWFAIKFDQVDRKRVPELFGEIFIWWYVVYFEPRLIQPRIKWSSAKHISAFHEWLSEVMNDCKECQQQLQEWKARGEMGKSIREQGRLQQVPAQTVGVA